MACKTKTFALLAGFLFLACGCADQVDGSEPPAPTLGNKPEVKACCASEPAAAASENQAPEPPALENSPSEEAESSPFVSAWVEPVQRPAFPLDYRMTNHEGTELPLDSLAGKPTVVAFFYSRCDNENKCKRVVSEMARLEEQMRQEGLESSVQIVLVSYTPAYDTPAILKAFGEKNGIKFLDGTQILRPRPDDRNEFFETLNHAVSFYGKKVSVHGIEVILIDAQGRIARRYRTLLPDMQAVLSDLTRLLAEAVGPTAHLEGR